MSKLIFLLIAGFVAYGLVRSYLQRQSRRDEIVQHPKTKTSGENMVRCKHCSVNLPVSEAVLSKGNYFCSNEHRLLHSK